VICHLLDIFKQNVIVVFVHSSTNFCKSYNISMVMIFKGGLLSVIITNLFFTSKSKLLIFFLSYLITRVVKKPDLRHRLMTNRIVWLSFLPYRKKCLWGQQVIQMMKNSRDQAYRYEFRLFLRLIKGSKVKNF
jgi:hypothetical protein